MVGNKPVLIFVGFTTEGVQVQDQETKNNKTKNNKIIIKIINHNKINQTLL